MPTRKRVGYYGSDHKQWDRDLDAYKTAVDAGVQPEHTTEKSARQARRQAGDYERHTA